VEDAIEAALLLDVSDVMGVHYDTFDPIRINREEAKKGFEEVGVTLHLLEVGESREVPKESGASERAKSEEENREE
jgi:L-ascorbate metabolism protein UlaG (beta-lactamase superfamily)